MSVIMSKKKHTSSDLVGNKKAFHSYEILEQFEAGIVLKGTEIKSLRDHGGALLESYVVIEKDEAWLINASIAPYKFGNIFNHEEKRKRKLLLHKYEIKKLKRVLAEKGLTLIALSMYLKKGKVKVKIATARGKKLYDKRQSIKEREQNLAIKRRLKNLS